MGKYVCNDCGYSARTIMETNSCALVVAKQKWSDHHVGIIPKAHRVKRYDLSDEERLDFVKLYELSTKALLELGKGPHFLTLNTDEPISKHYHENIIQHDGKTFPVKLLNFINIEDLELEQVAKDVNGTKTMLEALLRSGFY